MSNAISRVLISLFLLSASTAFAAEPRTYIAPQSPADTDGLPFSGAVRVGDTLYLSGNIGIDENFEVPDDPAQEARNVMDAIRDTVEAAGMTMDDLVYVQIFCSDVAHYEAFNEVYRTYFTQEFPARAFLGAGTLLFGARFEVQGIAVARPE